MASNFVDWVQAELDILREDLQLMDELKHKGTPHEGDTPHSGRYAWGSGDTWHEHQGISSKEIQCIDPDQSLAASRPSSSHGRGRNERQTGC